MVHSHPIPFIGWLKFSDPCHHKGANLDKLEAVVMVRNISEIALIASWAILWYNLSVSEFLFFKNKLGSLKYLKRSVWEQAFQLFSGLTQLIVFAVLYSVFFHCPRIVSWSTNGWCYGIHAASSSSLSWAYGTTCCWPRSSHHSGR